MSRAENSAFCGPGPSLSPLLLAGRFLGSQGLRGRRPLVLSDGVALQLLLAPLVSYAHVESSCLPL